MSVYCPATTVLAATLLRCNPLITPNALMRGKDCRMTIYQERWSKSKQRVYYLNAETKESTWDKPEDGEIITYKHDAHLIDRDLLAFENRIQYNYRKHQRISSKYKYFTGSGIIILAYLGLALALSEISDRSKSWHVFIGILTTFTLFSTWFFGILGVKLSSLQIYIQRMNNSLKPFHLSIGANGSLQFKRSVPQDVIQKFHEYKNNALETMKK